MVYNLLFFSLTKDVKILPNYPMQANVYVNTTNRSLDLSQGGLSPVLLEAAGQTLQDECNKKAPIEVGDIAVTSGGNLKCKYVFHVVGKDFDGHGGKGEKVRYDCEISNVVRD